jgi:hypothetical protein
LRLTFKDGEGMEEGEILLVKEQGRNIQKIIEEALNEENIRMSISRDKGKNKIGEGEENIRRGFSPTQWK